MPQIARRANASQLVVTTTSRVLLAYEKAHNTPKGSEGSSPEKANRDLATERVWDSPMPTGQPIPFDPELYEPPR